MSEFAPDHPGAEVRPSPNFGSRRGIPGRETQDPDMIVLHYTGMESGAAAEDWLCNPKSEVSSHYIVHEDGRTVQMVREKDRAWHAGKSFWHDVTDNNSCSIGIEIVNPGHSNGYPAFPKRQIDAVIALCAGIVERHSIAPERILAHSDIAPGRKIDPGEKFPWRTLYEAGVGHLVPAAPIRSAKGLKLGDGGKSVEELQSLLQRYGYEIAVSGQFDNRTRAVVEAFQRHFRPRRADGVADASTMDTLRRLLADLENAG